MVREGGEVMLTKEERQRADDILARHKNGFRFFTPGFPPGYVPRLAAEACKPKIGTNQYTRNDPQKWKTTW